MFLAIKFNYFFFTFHCLVTLLCAAIFFLLFEIRIEYFIMFVFDYIFKGLCGNWIEIAYGTRSGSVRVIVQHPETVGHGPQLFQTFTVHQSPVTKVKHIAFSYSSIPHRRNSCDLKVEWGIFRFLQKISPILVRLDLQSR